ncbi:hypothetical protein NE237_022489 [Protea cynaroides]|uniref:t-SNARE coiled-coil homology domain-containing protein n=1 Tax=Protea cynaroides TaxID=273540 RepID=A0A9Q0HB31_9MAGN|nr:hypothetical protein NE237_022489 [Protea cynaroides]
MNDLMTKSFLNYVELKKQALKDLEAGPDIEMGQLGPMDEENLAQFFEEVAVIKAEMEEITNLLLDLQGLNEDTKSTHSDKVLKGLRDMMDSDMVSVLRKAKIIKARLEILDQSNRVNRNLSAAYGEGSPVDRTRISVTNGLRTKLRDMMNKFQSLREKIDSNYKEGLKRRYFNATGQVPSEEVIEKMMEGGEQVQVLQREKQTNLENQERQEAVTKIKRSLTELHQVFLDMAVLIETQDQQIDDIEQNLASAGDFISGGTNQLMYANKMNRRRRPWVYWVWVLLLIIVLVCLMVSLSS